MSWATQNSTWVNNLIEFIVRMKNQRQFIKDRSSDELTLLRSNIEVLPASSYSSAVNFSTPKIENMVERSRTKLPHPLNYQNLLTFSFEKENNKKLSFSNLKKSLKTPLVTPTCGVHPSKRATHRELDSQRMYCTNCAIQIASKGIGVEEMPLEMYGQ